MSASVISLRAARDAAASAPQPHGSGEAHCIGCGHKWVAVAPVGLVRFECPECHAMKGHWVWEFAPADGELMRVCNCGNDLFRLTPEGHMCANCGTYQSYD